MSITQTQPAILLLGDSITQYSNVTDGLATKLSDLFVRKYDVINRGFAGYNTRNVLPIARHILKPSSSAQPIAFMTLWLGANDAVLASTGSRQSVPLEDYRANLVQLLNLVPASVPKFLITPPIPNPKRWAAFKETDVEDRNEENAAKYAQVVREVAVQVEGSVLVDVWKAMEVYRKANGGLDDLLLDGLHLTPKGYNLVNSVLIPLIEEKGLTNAPQTYPDWQDAPDV